MPKRDDYDDQAAPEANSIVVAVPAAVRNRRGELLLIRQRPVGSAWRRTGLRRVRGLGRPARGPRGTGIEVEITGLSRIYSDSRHVIAYGNGEVRQEFSLCFHTKPVGGEFRTSSESRQARWIFPDSPARSQRSTRRCG